MNSTIALCASLASSNLEGPRSGGRALREGAAVRNAIARGAIGFDAVKHLVLCRIERRPPRLDMTVYPYLPQADVAMTSAKTYLGLLTGAAS